MNRAFHHLVCLIILSAVSAYGKDQNSSKGGDHRGNQTTAGGHLPLTGDTRFASMAGDPATIYPFIVLQLDWDNIDRGTKQAKAILDQVGEQGTQDVSDLKSQLDLQRGLVLDKGNVGVRTPKTFKENSALQLKGDLTKRPKFVLVKINKGKDEDLSRTLEINAVDESGNVTPIRGGAGSEITVSGNFLVNDTFLKAILGENGKIYSYGKTQEDALRFIKR